MGLSTSTDNIPTYIKLTKLTKLIYVKNHTEMQTQNSKSNQYI